MGYLYVPNPQCSASGYEPKNDTPANEKIWPVLSDPEGKPLPKMKNAMKTNNYAPNLLDREFESYGPRLVLLTDITYIPLGADLSFTA